MFQRIVTAALCIGVMGAAVSAKDYALGSPSGQLVANISAGDGISYYVSFGGENVIAPSALSMTLSDGQVVGDGKVRKAVRKSVDETVSSPLYRRSEVRDNYNALTLKLEKVGRCSSALMMTDLHTGSFRPHRGLLRLSMKRLNMLSPAMP